MPNNPETTVTLTVEAWKAIMEFVTSSCQQKSTLWILWGRELNRIIQSSVDNALGISPKQQYVPQKLPGAVPRLIIDGSGGYGEFGGYETQKTKHSVSEVLRKLEWLDQRLGDRKTEPMAREIKIMLWELKETERILDNKINAVKPKKTMKCIHCGHDQEVIDPQVVWLGGSTKRTQYNKSPYYHFKCERCGEDSYQKT